MSKAGVKDLNFANFDTAGGNSLAQIWTFSWPPLWYVYVYIILFNNVVLFCNTKGYKSVDKLTSPLFTSFVYASYKCIIYPSVMSRRAVMPLPGQRQLPWPTRFCVPLLSDELAVASFQEGFCCRLKPRAFMAGCKQRNAFLGINFHFGQLIPRSCSTGDLDEKLSC